MIDYAHDLLFLLNDIARLLRVAADRRARGHGMTRAQWGILLWLERKPGLSQRELATTLDVEPVTVARLVDRLERNGAVERRADGSDRRIWRLHLTAAAQPILDDIHRHREELAAALTEGMAPALRAAVLEGLVQMKGRVSADRVRQDVAKEAA